MARFFLGAVRSDRTGSSFTRGVSPENPIHFLQLPTVPGPEAVPDPCDLALTGLCRQRDGVEIVQDDLPPGLGGLGPAEIGANGGRCHLGELVARRGGQAVGRVAKLLDLCRQCARAGNASLPAESSQAQVGRAPQKPRPLDRRILQRLFGIHQASVLDEEKRLPDQWRDRIEGLVGPLGISNRVE